MEEKDREAIIPNPGAGIEIAEDIDEPNAI